jgi:hypothetical protein
MLLPVLVLASLIVMGFASYAGYVFWKWAIALYQSGFFSKRRIAGFMSASAIAFAGGYILFPLKQAAVFAQSIEVDLQPFFDNLSIYLPVFIGIFGIVAAIAGAMALARNIMSAVVKAFSGGSL